MGRIILSICALVVAVALTGSGQGPGNSPGREAGTDKSNASASQNVQVTADLSRIASALEAQNANANTDREQRDLEAQEDMAKWAQAMFWAAAAQALLSAVGIALIYVTFRETHRAANSAEEIVTVTRESAERQLRAYVHFSEFTLVNTVTLGARAAAETSFQNCGQTPAKITRVVYAAGVAPDDEEGWDVSQANGTRDNSLGPGNRDTLLVSTRTLNARAVSDVNSGAELLYFFGRVDYQDAFGRNWYTRFRYIWAQNPLGKEVLFRCPEGNDAT